MIHSDRSARRIALLLAGLAGFVDAVGFQMLGGFFVSFMSGNTTRMAVGVVERTADGVRAGALILMFMAGVVVGSLVGRRAQRRHRAVLWLMLLMLLLAACAMEAGWSMLSGLMLCAAMGTVNAMFERDGEVRVGLTYMTGALVKAGQSIAGRLSGEGGGAAYGAHLLLWMALACGAVLGAIAFQTAGAKALWGAVIVGLLSARGVNRLDEQQGP